MYSFTNTFPTFTMIRFCVIVSLFLPLRLVAQSPALIGEDTDYEQKCSGSSAALHNASIQSFPDFLRQKQASALTASASRGYDVIRYDLSMDWTQALLGTSESGRDRQFSGVQIILLRLDSAGIVLPLHAAQIRIDSLFWGEKKGQLATPTGTPENETVYIALPATARSGDTLQLRLHYTHIGLANDDDGTGFILFRKGRLGTVRAGNDSVFLPQRLAYTMSEPYGARRWMPCNDVPNDKALVSIRTRVPKGYTVVSNGLLQERRLDSTGGETFLWTHQSPIAPYLMAVSASVFETYREWYKKVSNPNDSIPVDNYFWKEDDTNLPFNNKNYNVRKALDITVGSMEAYSRWFGEYPFEKYGHVVVQPFFAGGMEHQSISTINRSWLRGSSTTGIPHELMHQWFGDKITCASWEHIWLNESMATYGEALWYESWGGRKWNMVAMTGFRDGYFASKARFQPVYVASPTTIDVIFNYATTYAKGSWVLHTLRRIYGDSVYFPAIRLYSARFAFKAATTSDLLRAFEETAQQRLSTLPVPVATVFQEWIYGSGNPIFGAGWRAQSASNATSSRVQVSLSQLQTGMNVPEVFHLPVEITFLKFTTAQNRPDTQRVVKTMVMNNRREQATFDLPFQPDSLIIDEADNILCEKLVPQFSPTAQEARLTAYPQPVHVGEALNVELSLAVERSITMDVVNVLGQRVAMIYEGTASPGLQLFHETLNLPTGTYFLRLLTGSSTTIQKCIFTP